MWDGSAILGRNGEVSTPMPGVELSRNSGASSPPTEDELHKAFTHRCSEIPEEHREKCVEVAIGHAQETWGEGTDVFEFKLPNGVQISVAHASGIASTSPLDGRAI